ncbi:MAG: aromatic ring-hydroxylating dioxygenase subunit alpha [Usitatibacter sp.]
MFSGILVANCWYVAGFSEQFKPRNLHGKTIAERPIALWRGDDGKMVAFDDRCVHKRVPISKGRFKTDGTVECMYHGLCYNGEGKCVLIPSQLEGPIPSKAKLHPVPVMEQDGLVWIWPGDPELAARVGPPRTPEIGGERWDTAAPIGPMHPKANYVLLIENLLDISHFYPLHDGNIGNAENSKIPVEIVDEVIDGNRKIGTLRRASNYAQPPMLVEWLGYEAVDRIHTHCILSPGICRVEMIAAPPGKLGTSADRRYVIYHTITPIDRKSHEWYLSVSCPSDMQWSLNPGVSPSQHISATFPEVIAQDLYVLELQQEMLQLPDSDSYTEVYLKADGALLRARKALKEMEMQEQGKAATQVKAGVSG